MFTFLHAADIHLDSPLLRLPEYEGAQVEKIRRATRDALENLVNLAIEKSVDFVVLAGDLYDGDWTDFGTGLFFVNQMGRLREAGIPVFGVYGNHDAASKITRSLPLPARRFAELGARFARLAALSDFPRTRGGGLRGEVCCPTV